MIRIHPAVPAFPDCPEIAGAVSLHWRATVGSQPRLPKFEVMPSGGRPATRPRPVRAGRRLAPGSGSIAVIGRERAFLARRVGCCKRIALELRADEHRLRRLRLRELRGDIRAVRLRPLNLERAGAARQDGQRSRAAKHEDETEPFHCDSPKSHQKPKRIITRLGAGCRLKKGAKFGRAPRRAAVLACRFHRTRGAVKSPPHAKAPALSGH